MSKNSNNPHSLINLYKESTTNVPILKYSWVLICTICILSFAAFLKLKNSDVFFYSIGVLIICFISFALSLFLRTQDIFIKGLLYVFLFCFISVMCASVLGFGYFIFQNKPDFYKRWFPDLSVNAVPKQQQTSKKEVKPTLTKPSELFIKSSIGSELKKDIAKKLKIPLSFDSSSKYQLIISYPLNGYYVNYGDGTSEYFARGKVRVLLKDKYSFTIEDESISQITRNSDIDVKAELQSEVKRIVKKHLTYICNELNPYVK